MNYVDLNYGVNSTYFVQSVNKYDGQSWILEALQNRVNWKSKYALSQLGVRIFESESIDINWQTSLKFVQVDVLKRIKSVIERR